LRWGDDRSSHAGDVRGEKVHAVAVEVAAGAVVMLGGPWVGVPGQELGGIGKKVSTITNLGELASTALREALWRDAETLVPKSYVANAARPSLTRRRP
jgi:hypothetical protein